MADFLTTFERYIRKSQHLFRYEKDFHKTSITHILSSLIVPTMYVFEILKQ